MSRFVQFPIVHIIIPALRFARGGVALLCAAALILFSAPLKINSVSAYVVQYTNTATTTQVKWNVTTINVALSSSLASPPSNFRGGSDLRAAARRALARWSAAANINFNVTDSNLQSASAIDGVNLITVANTSANNALFSGSNLIGRAVVAYGRLNGFIADADVVLNPATFYSTDGAAGSYDAEEEFMHEIGHLLGLDHTGVLGATMRPYTVSNNQYFMVETAGRTLSADDVVGIQSLYGARNVTPRGEVSGVITSVAGAPVAGAHVWVELATTGQVAGSSVTLANGAYRIAGLAPGSYRMQVEALDEPVAYYDMAFLSGAVISFRSIEVVGKPARASRSSAMRNRTTRGIKVTANNTTRRDFQVNTSIAASINPQATGVANGGNLNLGFAAVPFAPGETKTVLVEGAGLTALLNQGGSITGTSPFVTVSNMQFIGTDSRGLPVLSVSVNVNPNAPGGDYSLRMRTASGEIAFLSGGITVELLNAGNSEAGDVEDIAFTSKNRFYFSRVTKSEEPSAAIALTAPLAFDFAHHESCVTHHDL